MRTDFIIRDINTGQLFSGLVEAAKHYQLSAQTIWNYVHIKNYRPAGTNPPVEAVPIWRLNKEIRELKTKVRRLEKDDEPMDEFIGCDPGHSCDRVDDRTLRALG